MEKLTGIKAVVFDIFGTIVEIKDKRYPYSNLLKRFKDSSTSTQHDFSTQIMSSNVGLAGAAVLCGLPVENDVLAKLELDLYAELASIQAYVEVNSTFAMLRDAGFKIGICSNLAAPYAVPVKLLLPFELDAYTWSFEAGAVKPSPKIYQHLCHGLDCEPSEIVMIGDTLESDYSAPRRFGIHGYHLSRTKDSPAKECLKSLDEILPLLAL